jgi:hypothetical protein
VAKLTPRGFVREGRQRSSLTSLVVPVLLCQLGVGVFLPIAEAHLEAGGELSIHVEAETTSTCAPAHDPMACSFCRVLGTMALGVFGASRMASTAVVTAHRSHAGEAPECRGSRAKLQARAPPREAQFRPQDVSSL